MTKRKRKIQEVKEVPTFYFTMSNASFFRNIIALLNVDEISSILGNEKIIENEVIVENFVIFNIYTHALKIRSTSRCKQLYAFFYMDAKCFDNFVFSEASTLLKVKSVTKKEKTETEEAKSKNLKFSKEYTENELLDKSATEDSAIYETNSVNSDNLMTSHAFDTEKRDIVKLTSISPLKKAIANNDELDHEIFHLRNEIYRQEDAKNNSYEIVVSVNELLRSFEFLQPKNIDFEYDKNNNKICVKLTDAEKDTSESIIKVIFIDEKNLVTRIEQDAFLTNPTIYFSLDSEVFSFCLEYLLNYNNEYIIFLLKEHVDAFTPVLEMITKNVKSERAVQMVPKDTFSSFRSNQNQRFKYRTKHLQKINQALKLSCYLRIDFQENGLARFQITLREYNLNGTHLCYFIHPAD